MNYRKEAKHRPLALNTQLADDRDYVVLYFLAP